MVGRSSAEPSLWLDSESFRERAESRLPGKSPAPRRAASKGEWTGIDLATGFGVFPCGKWLVPVQDERVLRGPTKAGDERLTSRLEAFGDLVFGFSLSLLALRLDVPSRVEEIFEPTRWLTVIVTFALICRFWLEHYRIFRHHFAVRTFDMVVNFVFLFGIAILPYAVQTFLRFKMLLLPFSLYLGDLILVLTTHAILRVRGLRQRRANSDEEGRLRDWRRSVAQLAGAAGAACLLVAMHRPGADFQTDLRLFGGYAIPGIVVLVLLVRRMIRRLPAFLREEG